MRESATAATSPTIREESLVHLHPLFFRPPVRQVQPWIVGVEKTALAIELPAEGVSALRALQAGQSIAATTALLEQEYGEAIDLVDLVQTLAEVGFVERIDDQPFAPPELIGQAWLARIPPAAVGWLYQRPTLIIAAVLLLAGPLLIAFQPALRPHAQDLLWSPSYTLNLFMMLVLGPFLLLKHELGHLLAARGRGLPAELTFGNRLFFLVAISRIGEIWKLRRADRLVIYSAGMLNDGVMASLCLLLLYTASSHLLHLPAELMALLRAIVLTAYLGIAWQFLIFLRTDGYHIMTELTGRHDLPEQTAAWLRSCWRAVLPHSHDAQQQDQPLSSDRLTLAYTALSVIGISACCLWYLFYGLPAAFLALHGELALLVTSIPANNVLAVLDGLTALCLQAVWFSLLVWSMVRKHIKRSSTFVGVQTS